MRPRVEFSLYFIGKGGIMLKRALCLTLLALLLLPALSGCVTESPVGRRYYDYFNTETTVTVWSAGEGNTENQIFETAEDILGEYHKLFDIYFEYSGVNNLATVNRMAGISPVEVDGKIIDFLLYAKQMHALTGGEMNVAVGAVTMLWHNRREAAKTDPQGAALPDMTALAEAAEHTDIEALIIDPAAGTVYFADPRLRLDVGALGKGYATEQLRLALIEAGVDSCVLNVGGNIAIIGSKPDGSDFLTGITNPKKGEQGAEQLITTLGLSDTSCVTSGDYERYYTVDGVRYHHVIDKDTLMPAEHFASVTVICEDGALADALSTALFCMSEAEGRALLGSLGSDIRVLWIDGDNNLTWYGEILP